ncbi:MAG: hypothetical protein WKF71_03580 [Pyrinomonadaceae bacterium]
MILTKFRKRFAGAVQYRTFKRRGSRLQIIMKDSAERLSLSKGKTVYAFVKANDAGDCDGLISIRES